MAFGVSSLAILSALWTAPLSRSGAIAGLARPAGGVVGFNDCQMPAVHKVLRFVATHRRYRELDVGLPVRFRPKRRVRRALGRLLGQTAPFGHRMKQDRYFEKADVWEPDWNSVAEF